MNDEFAGQGGSYVFENGVRRRVEEPTKDHPEGNRPRDADGKPLDISSPSTGEGEGGGEKPARKRTPAIAAASGD